MGTTGSGSFGSYRDFQKKECPEKINIKIEDIDTSQFFMENDSLPTIDTKVFINDQLVNKRLVVVEIESNLILGNVPSAYSYLLDRCLQKGRKYIGKVIYVSTIPVNTIMVELNVE